MPSFLNFCIYVYWKFVIRLTRVLCKSDVKSDTMQQVPKLLDKEENDIKKALGLYLF